MHHLQGSQEEDELQKRHTKCLLMQETFLKQRARINFANQGDRNSKFFHATMVVRNRRNTIKSIELDNGEWITCEKRIKAEFVRHFRAIYTRGNRESIYRVFNHDLLLDLPKIPTWATEMLESVPNQQEIKVALISLGPDKAPGPDGFNARMIQDNWDTFGPAVTAEITNFFNTGLMSSQMSRSNLILVPKVDSPARVTDYRPISVCNTLYKVASKILAARLRPFIADCISISQSAFLPGREITENIILLREVLHSFKQKGYKESEFCLKADLSKAFDQMEWEYIRDILPLYGFPPRLANWIMACVQSAKFSVVVNGVRDDFLKPQCGLRQGCPLSPYLFILGMDLLSRRLNELVGKGDIRGIKLHNTGMALTNCIYADDLLLFGSATKEEAQTIANVLSDFQKVSGQRVGLEKSKLWFSKNTNNEDREQVATIFAIPDAPREEGKYLGLPIHTGKALYDSIVDKFSSRLQSWKGKLLSPAGRVVLIKSVLQSLPIYTMATTKLPVGVLKALTAQIRRFFWGAQDKDRYLAYVAWAKIVQPIENGGLGIRDLTLVNEALLMKSLFKLASNFGALWTMVVRAKYLKRGKLWVSKRTYNCSVFWRNLMALRERLIPMIHWDIGDGATCEAIGQPWVEGIYQLGSMVHVQTSLKVNQLVDGETGNWDVDHLTSIFGYLATMRIIATVKPPTAHNGKDRLIFDPSTNGAFSVKKTYQLLLSQDTDTQQNTPSQGHSIWKSIWKKGKIVPRVRLFLWKLVNEGLPLSGILASRTSKGDPTCATCCQGEESVNHFAFLCPFSRLCWFSADFPIRSEHMAADIREVLAYLSSVVSDEEWTIIAHSLWAIWRCRNEKAYQGVAPTIQRFRHIFSQISFEASLAKNTRGSI